uniref:diacylglycerol O-acyltransferase n=2 Tax=Rhizophora mucronata TaxID=61149 RepID=A0A2P2M8M0_RHIMU
MAVLTTAEITTSSDPSRSLRRRPCAGSSAGDVADLVSASSSAEEEDILETEIDRVATMEPESSNVNGNERVGGEKVKIENRGEQDVKFVYRPYMPAHRSNKDSPLSSDAIFKQSHAGLLNLCIVVLVAVNSRLIIENLMKYGWLIRAGFWFSSRSLRDWPLLMCCLTLPIFPLTAYLVEKTAYRKYISEPVVVLLHIIITTAAILYPIFVILSCDSAFLSGVTLMLFTCIVWLKLVSYAHTNNDMRAIAKSMEKGDALPISLNLDLTQDASFKSLVYFMVAPTLCYQPSYPRTACVRQSWVLRQFVKLIIFTGLMGFIIEQYINPIVQNSQHPLKGNLLYAIERVLKLSVPNLYVWLCMFYCFFHLW